MDADIAAKILAKRFSSAATPPAMSAYEIKINRCPITDLDVCYAFTNGDNIAAKFMPHYSRCFAAEPAAAHVKQRKTHATCAHLQNGFSVFRVGDRAIFDRECLTPVSHDGRLHRTYSIAQVTSGAPHKKVATSSGHLVGRQRDTRVRKQRRRHMPDLLFPNPVLMRAIAAHNCSGCHNRIEKMTAEMAKVN